VHVRLRVANSKIVAARAARHFAPHPGEAISARRAARAAPARGGARGAERSLLKASAAVRGERELPPRPKGARSAPATPARRPTRSNATDALRLPIYLDFEKGFFECDRPA
jgi:hypothetical protein